MLLELPALALPALPALPALWPALVDLYPAYADYQARTERQIPLVVLQPRD